MGFQTILRYSTDVGLQGASSVNEEGKPQQICLQGLQSATTYYAMADLLEDGVRVAQSEKANFTTLAAGAMSVTYSYYRRNSCDEHVVVYSYSSTYAPSSCILHAVGPNNFVANYQGIIDSSNNTVTFEIDDWDGGVNYDVYATLYDIYGEEQQSITTTLTSGTINTISLTPTAATETTVTLEIDKCDDCGFYVGWVDYWLSTQDPDTDPSIAHEYFNSTDTSITITGLSSDTAYYFRATFVCDDEQTEVTGAAVSATTAHDYSGDYFYLENKISSVKQFTLKVRGKPKTTDLAYSFDKTNWTSFGLNATETVNVLGRRRIYLRSTTGLNNGSSGSVTFSMSGTHTAGGHIASLLDYRQMGRYTRIPEYSLGNLFNEDVYLTGASDIDFTGVTYIGIYGCSNMFRHCSGLTSAPDLNDVKHIDYNGCEQMFTGCSSLISGPDLSSIERASAQSCEHMFSGCSNLTSVNTPNISSWDTSAFIGWLNNVAASGVVHKPAALTIPTDTTSGVPSGWTTQNY